MDTIEKILSDDQEYYEQRVREFRRDVIQLVGTEEYCVTHMNFKQSGVYAQLDTTVRGHPLNIAMKDTEWYDFSVLKNGDVRLYSASAGQFFDSGMDQAVLNELKALTLKENTLAGFND